MPIFFAVSIILCIMLSIKLYSAKNHQDKISAKIRDRESKSFNIKSKDISLLPYISLQEILPKKLSDDPYLNDLQNKLIQLSEKKILNLTGYTNTDLRYMYGTNNLTFLMECDSNFYRLCVLIHKIGEYLYEKGDINEVKRLYEFAICNKVDISDIYLTLSKIYLLEEDKKSLSSLIKSATSLNSLTKQKVLSDIKLLEKGI